MDEFEKKWVHIKLEDYYEPSEIMNGEFYIQLKLCYTSEIKISNIIIPTWERKILDISKISKVTKYNIAYDFTIINV